MARFSQARKQLELVQKSGDIFRGVLLDESDLAAQARADADVTADIVQSTSVRLLPVTGLGLAHTDLSHKFSCLLHTVGLETGHSRRLYLKSVVACLSDQGISARTVTSRLFFRDDRRDRR